MEVTEVTKGLFYWHIRVYHYDNLTNNVCKDSTPLWKSLEAYSMDTLGSVIMMTWLTKSVKTVLHSMEVTGSH